MENIELSPWQLWGSAIGWTIIGVTFIKLLVYPRSEKFKPWYWLKDNGRDVLLGILLTLITVKLGAIIFDMLAAVGVGFGPVTEVIEEAGLDPVQSALVIAMLFQWWLWKRREKKRKSET